jgi:hypothetical protein
MKEGSVSVFSNEFIEMFSPEKLSNITDGGNLSFESVSWMRPELFTIYMVIGIVVLVIIFGAFDVSADGLVSTVKHTINQHMLWFYLGNPNEIHAVEIPESSTVKQFYDVFDML